MHCACNAQDEAIKFLRQYVERHLLDENSLCFQLLDLLVARGDVNAIEQLACQYEDAGVEHMALWFRSRVLDQQGDWVSLEAMGQKLIQHEIGREWHGCIA